MFLTAGYLVETMTGQSWEDAVRALVFAPLGMTRSNFSVVESQKDADFAFPYDERDGKSSRSPSATSPRSARPGPSTRASTR